MAKPLYMALLFSVVLAGAAAAQTSGIAGTTLANPYGAVMLPGTTVDRRPRPPRRAIPRRALLRVGGPEPVQGPAHLPRPPRRPQADRRRQEQRRAQARIMSRLGCFARLQGLRGWPRL